jgi:hypothetical protein
LQTEVTGAEDRPLPSELFGGKKKGVKLAAQTFLD